MSLNNYTGHTCRASLRCVSSYVLSDHLRGRLINDTDHIGRASLHCVFLYDFSDGLLVSLNSCTDHTCWMQPLMPEFMILCTGTDTGTGTLKIYNDPSQASQKPLRT